MGINNESDFDDTIWLTDDGDSSVKQCTLDGKLLMTLGIPGRPSPYMSGLPFHRCTHTALSPKGEIFVSDGYGNSAVHKFSPDGKLLKSWGGPGTDPGEFNIVHNIVCDDAGWVYVADRENHRVQVFDGKGDTDAVEQPAPSLRAVHDRRQMSGVLCGRAGAGAGESRHAQSGPAHHHHRQYRQAHRPASVALLPGLGPGEFQAPQA